MEKKTILVTGTLGFIFSNFIRNYADLEQYRFVGVDKAVRPHNLKNQFSHPNYTFYFGDISDTHAMETIFKIEKPDIVINGAAESFVDFSINSALPFVQSNVVGTQVMIDLSIKYQVQKFIQISTDEVCGQLTSSNDLPWLETAPLQPRNPYSATKGAAELLVNAAYETHKLPTIITRCCNNYGPRQQEFNLVPKIITSIINNNEVPISGTGQNIREWIYVEDHNSAIMTVLEKGNIGETYNIGSSYECTNLEMVDKVAQYLKKIPLFRFMPDRKGHDYRYSLNCDKIKKLGWQTSVTFGQSLEKCIKWYVENPNYYV